MSFAFKKAMAKLALVGESKARNFSHQQFSLGLAGLAEIGRSEPGHCQ